MPYNLHFMLRCYPIYIVHFECFNNLEDPYRWGNCEYILDKRRTLLLPTKHQTTRMLSSLSRTATTFTCFIIELVLNNCRFSMYKMLQRVYLLIWNTSGQQLYQIPCLDNDVRIPGLTGRSNSHATADHIKFSL